MRKSTAWFLFVLIALIFGVAFLWPLGRIIQKGFFETNGTFTPRFIIGVFKDPVLVAGMFNSFKIAVGTTLLVTLISVPLAWMANRFDFFGKGILQGLLLVPMILPPFVGAIGFQQMFGQYGSLNTLFGLGPIDWTGQARYLGVIILEALALYPIMYLNVSAALANVDPAMEQAAQNLGSTGFQRFRRITLPLIMPGLFAGGTIVFIWSFTELGTPLIMQYERTTPVQVYNSLKDIGTSAFPYALVFVMLVVSVGLYVVGKFIFGRRSYAMQSKASSGSTTRPPRGIAKVLVPLSFVVICFIALLPHIGVVLTAFSSPGSWYRSVIPQEFTTGNFTEALGHSMTVGSIYNSLVYASVAVVLNLILGIAIAFVVVRSNIPFRGVLDTLAMLPLAVPGIVLAFGYIAISAWLANLPTIKASDTLRALFDFRANPTLFLITAYAIRRLPYMVRSAVAGLQQTSVTLEEASANLGASGFTTARRITMPLIVANVIAGAMLAFAFAMLEVSDSLMLAQQQDYFPITKTIYELFQLIGTGKYLASALGVWAMVFLAATILGASAILGKKMGAIFRV